MDSPPQSVNTPLRPPTVGTLIEDAELGLRLVEPGAPDRLTAPLRSVHCSDLLEPAGFVISGVMLLTTGDQLADDPDRIDAYLRALAGTGIVALGIGSEARPRITAAMRSAARTHAVPLVEVPPQVPLLAVSRAGTDLVAAHAYAQRTWELSAHRALASAALRKDGLDAALAELARRLDRWVGLCDLAGGLVGEQPVALPADTSRAVRDAARELLAGDRRAAHMMSAGTRDITLQTLGRRGELRGVLAVESGPLDAAGRGLVTTFAAMASFVQDQAAAMSRARARLRTTVLTSLEEGNVRLATQLSTEVLGGFPTTSVRLAVTRRSRGGRAMRDFLEQNSAPGELFFGELRDWLVLLLPETDDSRLDEFADRFGIRFGVSRPARLDRMPAALDEAIYARRHTTGAVTRAEQILVGGVLATLGSDAELAARVTLYPLETYDLENGTALLSTLQTWLEHDTQHEPTARALGVHRHTVRARLGLAEKVLRRDLGSFRARAELWAAVVARATVR